MLDLAHIQTKEEEMVEEEDNCEEIWYVFLSIILFLSHLPELGMG